MIGWAAFDLMALCLIRGVRPAVRQDPSHTYNEIIFERALREPRPCRSAQGLSS